MPAKNPAFSLKEDFLLEKKIFDGEK